MIEKKMERGTNDKLLHLIAFAKRQRARCTWCSTLKHKAICMTNPVKCAEKILNEDSQSLATLFFPVFYPTKFTAANS